MSSYKAYNKLDFKERFIHRIHDDLAFNCSVKLKEDEFHTCPECQRRVNIILMFLEFETSRLRQQKV